MSAQIKDRDGGEIVKRHDSPVIRRLVVLSWFAAGSVLGCGPTLGTPPMVCSTQAVNAGQSELMEPGGDCISCHASNGGPGLTFAGTVMNARDDDQNCRGVQGVQVRITDAAGKVIEMTANANGNFISKVAKSSITFPYTAEVSSGGKTARMMGARSETETDCAGCHTAAGDNGAPGRILAP